MKTAARTIALALAVGLVFGYVLAAKTPFERRTRVTEHAIEVSPDRPAVRLVLGEFCPDASGRPAPESCWLIWFSDAEALGRAVECWHRPWLTGEPCPWPPEKGVVTP